ncbi:hypothetical protein CLOSTMETH_03433 [[Clostridium] methylpentosum DSM 5476]|uniref:Uncharacterized protein n=1 Tax=[Clostridium] methylpentosum DSM 5476 TaxID=537013 RepID=C0EHT8_9FIRM|nr:hypothetical protein CLOSTMETH_03433 [[Clostridium] methylpentosum DSM 5476]
MFACRCYWRPPAENAILNLAFKSCFLEIYTCIKLLFYPQNLFSQGL